MRYSKEENTIAPKNQTLQTLSLIQTQQKPHRIHLNHSQINHHTTDPVIHSIPQNSTRGQRQDSGDQTTALTIYFERFTNWVSYQTLRSTFNKFGTVQSMFIARSPNRAG